MSGEVRWGDIYKGWVQGGAVKLLGDGVMRKIWNIISWPFMMLLTALAILIEFIMDNFLVFIRLMLLVGFIGFAASEGIKEESQRQEHEEHLASIENPYGGKNDMGQINDYYVVAVEGENRSIRCSYPVQSQSPEGWRKFGCPEEYDGRLFTSNGFIEIPE